MYSTEKGSPVISGMGSYLMFMAVCTVGITIQNYTGFCVEVGTAAMRSGVQGVILLLLVVGCNTSKVTDPIPEGVIKGSGRTVGYGELKEEWRGEIVQLSWEPRAYLLKGFLEEEECEHLKKMVRELLWLACIYLVYLISSRIAKALKIPKHTRFHHQCAVGNNHAPVILRDVWKL